MVIKFDPARSVIAWLKDPSVLSGAARPLMVTPETATLSVAVPAMFKVALFVKGTVRQRADVQRRSGRVHDPCRRCRASLRLPVPGPVFPITLTLCVPSDSAVRMIAVDGSVSGE